MGTAIVIVEAKTACADDHSVRVCDTNYHSPCIRRAAEGGISRGFGRVLSGAPIIREIDIDIKLVVRINFDINDP